MGDALTGRTRPRVEDFDYDLPGERIAQEPLRERDHSRLLVLPGGGGESGGGRPLVDERFRNLGRHLRAGDLLVLNETRVVPARLALRRDTGDEAGGRGGRVDALLLAGGGSERSLQAFLRPSNRLREGERLLEERGPGVLRLARGLGGGRWLVEILEGDLETLVGCGGGGRAPLPPYIRREPGRDPRDASDLRRYQTVYARAPGAVAAPTAGLHFTRDLLERLAGEGIEICGLTLHVGPGTFLPVRAPLVEDHRMEPEAYEIPARTASRVDAARREGRRVVAVGTTTCRALEGSRLPGGGWKLRGSTDLFIRPPYGFRVVDLLLTNFHMPRSTLLMLVAAFAGRERVLGAYRHAVGAGYRFLSYGDAMLVSPGQDRARAGGRGHA